jgi:hypothetical protein
MSGQDRDWFVLFKRKKGREQFEDTVKKNVRGLERQGCRVHSVAVRYPDSE